MNTDYRDRYNIHREGLVNFDRDAANNQHGTNKN